MHLVYGEMKCNAADIIEKHNILLELEVNPEISARRLFVYIYIVYQLS